MWLYVHDEWPVDQLDHINGNRGDNCLANLRLANTSENAQNRVCEGVSWDIQKNKFKARNCNQW